MPKNQEKPNARYIQVGDKKIEVRVVTPSQEAITNLGKRSSRTIVGFLAINPLYIEKEIALQKAEILRSLATMSEADKKEFMRKGEIDFVKDKEDKGYKKYKVLCSTCGDDIATVWAKDDTLKDWCDAHYTCKHDRKMWYGCMALNVSPVDNQLGFECACGEDTREFRGNKNLPPIQRQLMIEYSLKHRKFAHPDSKFVAIKI